MKLSIQLEIDVKTVKHEVEGCEFSEPNFRAWVEEFMRDTFTGDFSDDIEYTSKVTELKFLD